MKKLQCRKRGEREREGRLEEWKSSIKVWSSTTGRGVEVECAAWRRAAGGTDEAAFDVLWVREAERERGTLLLEVEDVVAAAVEAGITAAGAGGLAWF
jgi:hypothetical protein